MSNETKITALTETLFNKADMGHLNNEITIKCDMKGKSAGQFQYKGKNDEYILRFNMGICEVNGWDAFEDTVAHEVAHLINHFYNGSYKNGKRVYPHGKEWKGIMRKLGYSPSTTHNYTLPDNVKKSNTYTYKCGCQTHELSKIRHNRMQKGVYKGKTYSLTCNKCKQKLVKA